MGRSKCWLRACCFMQLIEDKYNKVLCCLCLCLVMAFFIHGILQRAEKAATEAL